MMEAILEVSMMLLIFAIFNFVLSIFLKRNDVADVGWGLGFILICIYAIIQYQVTPVAAVAYGMVIIWGSRLAIHIGIRNAKKSEDFRYKKWRDDWQKTFYWRSFLQVYLLQMTILLIIALPILTLAVHVQTRSISLWHMVVVLVWLIGFLWESVADYQLVRFKRKKTGKIMTSGLWKYSRHPNYFGEIVMCWALFFYVVITHPVYYIVISPILLSYLLLRVSGVPMLEEKYKNNSEYREYVKSVPAIWPFGRLMTK